MIQAVQTLRAEIRELAGFIGYGCELIGVLMLLFSFFGGRVQGEKIVKAIIVIVAGALLMQFAQTTL